MLLQHLTGGDVLNISNWEEASRQNQNQDLVERLSLSADCVHPGELVEAAKEKEVWESLFRQLPP